MQSLAKRDNVYLAQRRAAPLLLTGINSIAFAPQFGFYEPWGTRYGLQLLLENTRWANLLGARGRCIAVGLPLLSQNFNCSVRLRLGLWITCYLPGAGSVWGELPVSRGWSQCAVTRMTRGWPLARMTLYSPLPCCSLPTFCPHHHYPGDGKRGFSPRFH